MRQLLPDVVDPVDLTALYGDVPAASSRPAVRLNMIASIDGATEVAGKSGGLGGKPDSEVFHVLRSLAEVILVAAGTVRSERYGPSRTPIAIVTRSCALDWDSALFTEALQGAAARPIVVTVAAAPREELSRARAVADVVVAGERDVDLAATLHALGERGFDAVLCEGGPTLNGQLAAAGLIDELCLSVSPMVVGGGAKRVLAGPSLAPPAEGGERTDWRLRSLCEQDGFLFLRYRAERSDGTAAPA